MSELEAYVYIHAFPNTSDIHGIFYVGKGIKNRSHDFCKRNQYHKRIVAKYGKEKVIVRKLACESKQHALDLEIQMIAKLRSIGVKLANLTDGGEGASGIKPSEETRLKLSIAKKNMSDDTKRKMSESKKNMSPETKKRMSDAQKGRVITDEHRRKLSNSLKKYVMTDEHKKKLSDAAKNRRGVKVGQYKTKKPRSGQFAVSCVVFQQHCKG